MKHSDLNTNSCLQLLENYQGLESLVLTGLEHIRDNKRIHSLGNKTCFSI